MVLTWNSCDTLVGLLVVDFIGSVLTSMSDEFRAKRETE